MQMYMLCCIHFISKVSTLFQRRPILKGCPKNECSNLQYEGLQLSMTAYDLNNLVACVM